MNLSTKKPSHKKLIIGALLVVGIIAACLAVYVYALQPKANDTSKKSSSQPEVNKVNTNPPTKEQVTAGEDTKRESVEKATEPAPPPSSSTPLVVSITSANQSGATVSIRSLIDTVASQSGTCSITITNGSKSTTKTATTQAYPSGSTCQGFNIATSELGAGSWNITLTVTIGAQTGTASQTLVVQ